MAPSPVKRRPQRTCIGCQHVFTKRELTRIVRRPNGEVAIDPTGKAAGRGAYLCPNRRCWRAALEHGRFGHALKVTLTPEQHAQIEAYASQLPDVEATSEET